MRPETTNLDNVLEDIETLRRGVDLLEKLYHALGPYGNFPFPETADGRDNPNQVWHKIQDYFGFDDSE